jgi:hypothetical protein
LDVSDDRLSVSDDRWNVSRDRLNVSHERLNVADDRLSVSDDPSSVSHDPARASRDSFALAHDSESVADGLLVTMGPSFACYTQVLRMSARPERLRTWLLVATASSLVAMAAPARAEGRAHAVAVPSWVDSEPRDPRSADVQVDSSGGVTSLLSDRQLKAGSPTVRYVRRAFRVDATSGIENVSELHIDYDPSYEKLVIHFVRILRGRQTIDALRGADWKVIQPESDMDRRIYSGEMEGLLILHDVRVGDVLDYAYSVEGDNPTLGGHFVATLALDEDDGVVDLRRRIVTDARRPLRFQAHGEGAQPDDTTTGGVRTLAWKRANVAATEDEDHVPTWYRSGPWVDVSDYASWNEVAASAAALFDTPATTSPELDALVAKWKSGETSDADRALAATRFVQDEVRYLGIEMGPHSHQPFAPAVVMQRRFGDCKDKSLLLVTVLRALGLEALPALVSTTEGRALDDRLPTPFAFDHAIARVTIGGVVTFVDATASLARGPLVGRTPLPFERALVVSRDAQALSKLGDPTPTRSTYDVDETYTLSPPGGGPVELSVVTTYRDDDADDMRAHVANTPVAELARRYVNFYARTYPKVRALSDPIITDDTATDVIVVEERYALPDFWQDGARDVAPDVMNAYLEPPKISRRKMPLSLTFPERVTARIHVVADTHDLEKPEIVTGTDGTVLFDMSTQRDPRMLTLGYEYVAKQDYVPVDKVAEHIALLDRVAKGWGYSLTDGASDGTRAANAEPVPPWAWWSFGGAVGLVTSALTVRATLSWRRRRAFLKRQLVAAGEAPTNPVAVPDEAAIDAHVAKTRCPCRAKLARAPASELATELRLGERVIRGVPVACPTCGTARKMYFEIRPRF